LTGVPGLVSATAPAPRKLPPRDALVGGALVAALALAALLAPWLAPFDPAEQRLEQRLQGPSAAHPLGLDELGRDVLSRLLHGARVSLLVGLSVVLLAGLLGGAAGALAGWSGGALDAVLMRLADVVLAFPGILLAIALVGVLGPALEHLIAALVAIGWVGYARLLRAQVLAWREREFVLAGRALGLPGWRLLLRHLLPNVLPPFLVQVSLGMAGAILAEASLSFLGLGIQAPTPSWGAMINAGRGHLLDAPHLTLFPGLAILAAVLGLNFLGDGLVEALDPERRS